MQYAVHSIPRTNLFYYCKFVSFDHLYSHPPPTQASWNYQSVLCIYEFGFLSSIFMISLVKFKYLPTENLFLV